MKIIILGSGKSYHATRWANSLSNNGIDVTFITLHQLVRPIDSGVNVIDLSSNSKISYLTRAPKIKRIIRKIKPDILHSHSAGGYAFLGYYSNYKPWVLSVYGADVYDVPEKSFIHKFYVGKMLKKADTLLSTSMDMARKVTATYPNLSIPKVTPFGVDTKLYKPSNKSDNYRIKNKIGIVKKLEYKYGIDVLLKAFDIVNSKEDMKRLELHIVGHGSEKKKLIEQKNQLNCHDRIFFRGTIPNKDVPEFLRTLDVFIVPSRYDSESFGVAAVEASAMGLPVIVSNVGGLPEVIDNMRTGIVVPKENPKELADAIFNLLKNEQERKRLGAAGRKKVLKEYDWEVNVLDMMAIYKTMTNA